MKRRGIELEFEIGAYEPETMPMARLAEYMDDLAKLLGEEHSVHFVRLRKGSTTIVHRVDDEAFPKIRDRAYLAKEPTASADIRQPYERLEKRLRQDNARGAKLRMDDVKLLEIRIPKRSAVAYPSIGRHGTLQGVVSRLGGRGEWVPVHLEDLDGTLYMCEAKKEQSKALVPFYLGHPIRVEGQGRWLRDEEDGWQLESFRIHSFEPLKDESIRETLARLRQIPAKWKQSDNPLADLQRIRSGE